MSKFWALIFKNFILKILQKALTSLEILLRYYSYSNHWQVSILLKTFMITIMA